MNESNAINWPPPYTIRTSRRAKQVNLRIAPHIGLEIVAPAFFNLKHIPDLLKKHQRWIEKNYHHIQPEKNRFNREIPQTLALNALNEQWTIILTPIEKKNVLIKATENYQLHLIGQIDHKKLIVAALQNWLKDYAQQKLIPWLHRLSNKTHLPFARASIRDAKTLWGSCSAKKNISLNCRLLFLPAELVEYVLLHELCHTIHLNHSKDFWNLLKTLNPDCQNLRKQLSMTNNQHSLLQSIY